MKRLLAIYMPGCRRYYSRNGCRCSSAVERCFRKAGVEGPNPSIGFMKSGMNID